MGSPWDTHTRTHAHAHTHIALGSVHRRATYVRARVKSRWESGGGCFFTGSCCCCCCKILSMAVCVCEAVVGKRSTRRGHDVVAELPPGNSRHSDRFQLTRSLISSAWRVTSDSQLFPQFYWIIVNFFCIFPNPPPPSPLTLAFYIRVANVRVVWLSYLFCLPASHNRLVVFLLCKAMEKVICSLHCLHLCCWTSFLRKNVCSEIR
jgi:hypothetical protein